MNYFCTIPLKYSDQFKEVSPLAVSPPESFPVGNFAWGSFTAGKPSYTYTRFELCVRTAGIFLIDEPNMTLIQHNNPYIIIFPFAQQKKVLRRDFPW